jgi:L-lactate dehydrogenase complex protein LldG
MKEATAKERVLKNIRNALIQKNENPFFDVSQDEPVYAPVDPIDEVAFAQALNEVAGNFIYCADEKEMLQHLIGLVKQREWNEIFTLNPNLADLLKLASIPVASDASRITEMKVGITLCESLVARLGSVLVSSAASDGRRMIVYPEIHLVIAYASQVVSDLKDAFSALVKRYGENLPSLVTIITGPSRTADIEKTLVMGAHGPKELIVFLIDDKNNVNK